MAQKKRDVVQQSLIPPPLLEHSGFMEAWTGFLEMRKEIKKPATEYAQKLLLRKVDKLSEGKVDVAIQILEDSVTNNWQDIYPLKAPGFGRNGHAARGGTDVEDLEFIQTGREQL